MVSVVGIIQRVFMVPSLFVYDFCRGRKLVFMVSALGFFMVSAVARNVF